MFTYAKIDTNQNPNLVVNIQLMQQGDYQDPAFLWVDVTNTVPQPGIGWTYSGGVFTPPGLPNDVYGYSVTMTTVGGNDVYVNSNGITVTVAHGTAQATAYLALAIQDNIAMMTAAGAAFVSSRYPDSVRINLIGLYMNATRSLLLSNRQTYLAQIYTWQNSIISYIASYLANINAQTNPNTVLGIVPNFAQFISSDPNITPVGAIQINN